MKHLYWAVCFLIIIDCTLRWTEGICVLDSDFGFNLNCGFKKSGLFRVRNLGGVKGYVGLGFSVGDELGFPDSLSNTDTNKRRSVAAARSANLSGPHSTRKRADTVRPVNPSLVTVPPFKPIPPVTHSQKVASPRNFSVPFISSPNIRTVPAPALIAAIPAPPPSFQTLPSSIINSASAISTTPPPRSQLIGVQVIPAPIAFRTSLEAATKNFQVRKDSEPAASDVGVSTNTLSMRQLPSASASQIPTSFSKPDIKNSVPTIMGSSIKLLAQATNLSEDAIAAAIAIRQQQLMLQQQQAELALATTSTTTKKPVDSNVINKYPLSSISKVMNAPKEYYPVGYDKNFDDNFASRVELPDTSFYCGDQKHFPGLYADEDLGCMVFHVCAFTDDGLIMKSFLCPESTLFDQSILKCNWWFYVDCKSSKKLYDSNIPISKSYQLMKALAFFSSYNKN